MAFQNKIAFEYRICSQYRFVQFNKYFASVGQKLAISINHTNEHDYKRYLSKILNCSFSLKKINPEDTSKIILNFLPKTSCGHDGLSTKLIKRLKDFISRPLSLIINESFCTGIFKKTNMKIAKIRPVVKKGGHDILDNYRTISILPALSKVFEKVAYSLYSILRLFSWEQTTVSRAIWVSERSFCWAW